MSTRRLLGSCLVTLLSIGSLSAATSELADATMRGNKDAVRTLLLKKADVNAPQVDGTTALHWAVRSDDMETADLLIKAGANVTAKNREGVMPLQLAALNGNAAMIERLIKAGVSANMPLSKDGDTALMIAARTGRTAAVKTLLDNGAQVNATETWGGTTPLMWAVSERHLDTVKELLAHGANVNAHSYFIPSAHGRGFEGATPVPPTANQAAEEYASGLLTPLMFAAREGDLEIARVLVAAGADINAIAGDGKDPLGLAVFNGQYELASYLIDNKANVNHADAQPSRPCSGPWIAATWNLERMGSRGL